MKENQLVQVRVIASNTTPADDDQKRKDEKVRLNHVLLFKEFDSIGLPDFMNDDAFYHLSTLNGEEWMMAFNTVKGGLRIKGRVYMEAAGPDRMYTISYFELVLEGLPDMGAKQNAFLYTPSCFITIEEAVNLLQGRYIYRKFEVDPLGEGCWLFLGSSELKPGFPKPLLLHNGFRVREYLAETGLGSWLGLKGFNQLVIDLEKGCRCDLSIGTGKGMRKVKVEADPVRQQLKVINEK